MGVTYDYATLDAIRTRLRNLVQQSFQNHLYATAIFYADKLVSLTKEGEQVSIDDLYTLAECYFNNREYKRVLHLLNRHARATEDDRLRLLAVQSLMECKEWEEALAYLENEPSGQDSQMASVFALLRGKVYEVQENQELALKWFKRAVDLDPYCYEAVERLLGNHLLNAAQEAELVRGLKLHESDAWLRQLYATRLTEDSPESSQSAVTPLPSSLAANGYTLGGQSIRYFYEGKYDKCYETSKLALEHDPYQLSVLPVHVAALVHLGHNGTVFYIAHQLVHAYPSAAVSWFAAGCYYFLIKKYEQARRFFAKATQLDTTFAPAWIAYGHAFAAHDESDQALAAYRTASRLFPGSHLPWLFIGVEYVRTNSLPLAQQCLEAARGMRTDPCVLNEMAVIAFHRGQYPKAVDLLRQALSLAHRKEEAFYNNLGHAYLKLEMYDNALEAFQEAQRVHPKGVLTLVGVAFTLQLLSRLDDAIEYYHRALAINRDDAFAQEMLNCAVEEAAELI
jgi:anaphase-promoting complex subunit 6